MNINDLFGCSPLLKKLESEIGMSNDDPEQLVLWPKTSVPLGKSPRNATLEYVESACDCDNVVIDPDEIPGCEKQLKTLQEHGYLEQGFHDRVLVINVKLNEEISDLTADVSINRQVVQKLEDFEKVKEIWGRFNVDPMNSFAWNLSWWKAFETTGKLHLMTFERAGEVVGVAPLYVDRWFGLSRLRFLATGDTCTDYVDLICDPDHYELCAFSLTEYIREQKFDVVEFECTKEDRLATLMTQFLDSDFRFDHREVEPTWRLDLPDTWDEFVSTRKKSLRRKVKKAMRRLETVEFEIATTSAGLSVNVAFDILKDLHTQRFATKDDPGAFGDPKFEKFLRTAVQEFSLENKCEIVIASQNQKPIACQLYFESNEGFQLYQSGYLPEAMKLEPGHLLMSAMTKRAIERGDRCFDFLRGNEPYKEFWGAEPHAQKKLRMVAKRVLPASIAIVVEASREVVRGRWTRSLRNSINAFRLKNCRLP